ncbi:MAG: hypothetical protein HY340_02110 [Candidatus Kerfeldbacteria bacterium]|nr:hypothetical protein [Candidatus Kerfeldbacteria bacterium]
MSTMMACPDCNGYFVSISEMVVPTYGYLWFECGSDPTPLAVTQLARCKMHFRQFFGYDLKAAPFASVLAKAEEAAVEKARQEHLRRMEEQRQASERAAAIRATVGSKCDQREMSRPAAYVAHKAAKSARDSEVRDRMRGLAGQSSSKKRRAA